MVVFVPLRQLGVTGTELQCLRWSLLSHELLPLTRSYFANSLKGVNPFWIYFMLSSDLQRPNDSPIILKAFFTSSCLPSRNLKLSFSCLSHSSFFLFSGTSFQLGIAGFNLSLTRAPIALWNHPLISFGSRISPTARPPLSHSMLYLDIDFLFYPLVSS